MERMPLALTGQGEAVKEHIFNRIPVELMIKIYKSLFDLKDVKATLSTCRRAKAIFYENAGDIAKAYLFRTLDPSNLKLLVMAVASRDVDPQDPASIEQFFRKYIWRSGPWPSSYITMDMVASLEPFCETCNHAWMWVSLPFEYKRTPTQEARKLRGGLMIETATNLFYRGPGKDGAIFWRSPNVEWADKYWEAFSRIEVMMVLEVSFYLQKIILHDLSCTFGNYIQPKWRGGEGQFAFTVGLKNLLEWSKTQPASISQMMELTLSSVPDGEKMKTPLDDAKRRWGKKTDLQPRFQPDPDAMDEEAWQLGKGKALGSPNWRFLTLSYWDKNNYIQFCNAVNEE